MILPRGRMEVAMDVLLLDSVSILEQVTLGQLLMSITFILSIVLGVNKIKGIFNNWVKKELQPSLNPLTEKIDKIEQQLEQLRLESCKNDLVLFLAEIERNEIVDEVAVQRFHEQYDFYTSKGGNSYIHRKYEKLKSEGKL